MSNVRFAKLDALLERERLLDAAAGSDSLFVDINGNRAAATVSALLRLLLYERAATARPRVTVVKCRALCRAAEYFEDTTRTEGITMNDAPSSDHAGTAFTSGLAEEYHAIAAARSRRGELQEPSPELSGTYRYSPPAAT